MADVKSLHTHPRYRPRETRDRTEAPTSTTSEFEHRGGFWALNVTLEDRRCGFDPYNHRGRGAFLPDRWD